MTPAVATEQDADSSGRLLIVDDEEPIRIALTRTLRRLGFEIMDVGDAEAGLEMVGSFKPDIIFLDLRMPGIDGHTFLRRLRTTVADPPPVIVISGHGDMNDVIEVMRSGAVDYLRKPWNLTELMSAVTRSLELRRKPADGAAPVPPSDPSEEKVKAASARAARFMDVQTKLRQGEIVLPAIPAVLTALQAKVRDPRSSLDDIATTVESDARVAADILRLANAPQFMHMGRAANAKVAVTRLGLRHVHNLVQTIFLQGFCNVAAGPYRKLLDAVWRRSVARGVSMRALCDVINPSLGPARSLNADTAYLIGMMADVGASLLLWVVSEKSSGTLTRDDVSDLDGAIAVVRRCHEELGRAMLSRWGLDELVCHAVAHHHREAPPAAGAEWWHLFALGDHLATGLSGDADPISPPPHASRVERAMAEFHIPRPLLDRLTAGLSREYQSIQNTITGAAGGR